MDSDKNELKIFPFEAAKIGTVSSSEPSIVLKKFWHLHFKYRERFKDSPKDVVILHSVPRGVTVPQISPFALKLETYMRMAKIPYEVIKITRFLLI